MIRGNDFILNPDKLQEEFQLVEVSDWVDYFIIKCSKVFKLFETKK